MTNNQSRSLGTLTTRDCLLAKASMGGGGKNVLSLFGVGGLTSKISREERKKKFTKTWVKNVLTFL